MFEVYELSLNVVKELKPLVDRIERRDRDLGRQIRRAASSISLNIAEGNERAGKDRAYHFRVAKGSAAEVSAALRVAAAWEYAAISNETLANLDRIRRMLYPLTR